MTDTDAALSIADVERDTGLTKDTLRVWERRYGFPAPVRDAAGDRLYPAEQVSRLRLIRRLMDQGHRPGKLLTAAPGDLATLASPGSDELEAVASEVLQRVRRRDLPGTRQALGQMLARHGLQRFVIDCLPPLLVEIGEAWARGQIAIFEEHLITEALQNTLRTALQQTMAQSLGHPVILLTTLPDEQHGLGMLMAQALLEPEGALCLSLGTQTPLGDICSACDWATVDVVAISVSAAYPTRPAITALRTLREMLPPHIELWAGGAGIARRERSLPGVRVMGSIADTLSALAAWRSAHPRDEFTLTRPSTGKDSS
jgi:methylmalonyl-CoA mutase cobalamin-binding subunit